MKFEFDFAGYATRNDLKCADGRIIRRDAFKECDGKIVPLVYNHDHADMNNVLGHALLENREDGVYAYGVFNDSEEGNAAKVRVRNRDITALSIYANQLTQNGPNVLHGAIREVSLVLAAANPGAYIETVMAHSDNDGESAIIYSPDEFDSYGGEIRHSAEAEKREDESMANEQKTVKEVFDTLTEDQKKAVYAIVGYIMSKKDGDDDSDDEEEEDTNMKHNVFDNSNDMTGDALSHSQMDTILKDGKRFGSLKESFIQHAAEYGIDQIDWLFPEAKSLNNPPEWIKRDTGWVSRVMSRVHHTPFSRIKSMYADITADEARAKGYMKGNRKTDEVFTLLKRTTDPQTVYKRQKLDRDDVLDITDFDVVAWLKGEMRMMLDEELARAFLVGDGRPASSDDKIHETHIRPVWTDDELYTIKSQTGIAANATNADKAKAFIDAVIWSRKDYKGSGNPVLYTTEEVVTLCLLLENGIGEKIYKSVQELATALRVSSIETVEVMENQTRTITVNGSQKTATLQGIIVNLNDYNVGADKGGAVNMFEDFDIDYNQQKYLIETRCSGALIKPKSAIAIEFYTA